jgi:hypothetical protein
MSDTCNQTPETTTPETPMQFDFSQVFYHKLCNAPASALNNLDLPNGTDLEAIIEAIDFKLNQGLTYNYNTASLDCLKGRYVIQNHSQFVDAMNQESCRLNTAFQSITNVLQALSSYNTELMSLKQIGVVNNCGMNFDYNSNIKTVLQTFINDYCGFKSGLVIPDSPAITALNNSTIAWSLSGILNHKLSAAVKLSSDSGNAIEVRPDGLYANFSTAPVAPQTLSWNFNTNTLSISGGNSVVIGFPGAQQLSLTGSVLNLSGGGGSVNLAPLIAPAITQTPLSASASNQGIQVGTSGLNSHTLSVGLKLSAIANNIAQIAADGLYVAPFTVSNGLTKTVNNVKLGGNLDQDTVINLVNHPLQFLSETTKPSYQFSDDGFKIFDVLQPNTNTVITTNTSLDSVVFQFDMMGTKYNYMTVNTWNGTSLYAPRLFMGIATAPNTNLGSRYNIQSSMGYRYHKSTAATFTITEDVNVYIYLGQATPANQNLTLPNPALSTGYNGVENAWILHIKNFSKDAPDTITTNYPIYTDDVTSSSTIAASQSFIIAAIEGKWVKIN